MYLFNIFHWSISILPYLTRQRLPIIYASGHAACRPYPCHQNCKAFSYVIEVPLGVVIDDHHPWTLKGEIPIKLSLCRGFTQAQTSWRDQTLGYSTESRHKSLSKVRRLTAWQSARKDVENHLAVVQVMNEILRWRRWPQVGKARNGSSVEIRTYVRVHRLIAHLFCNHVANSKACLGWYVKQQIY